MNYNRWFIHHSLMLIICILVTRYWTNKDVAFFRLHTCHVLPHDDTSIRVP